ncbi:hypothetical protein COCNU_scaffold000179G000010 [Cocos nucifera]|nr:hypothetical protein [Cocos nucifera]
MHSSASEEQSEHTLSTSASATQEPPSSASTPPMVSTPLATVPLPLSIFEAHATMQASKCASSSQIFHGPIRASSSQIFHGPIPSALALAPAPPSVPSLALGIVRDMMSMLSMYFGVMDFEDMLARISASALALAPAPPSVPSLAPPLH